MKRAHANGHAVLDPFAGAGTTIAAARQLGIAAVGLELSELGLLISQVRLFPPSNLEQAISIAQEWVSNIPKNSQWGINDVLTSWLGERNSKELGYLLHRLNYVRDISIRRVLRLALSSSLRPSSTWLPGSIKPQVDPSRSPPSLAAAFLRSVRMIVRDCKLEAVQDSHSYSAVLRGDARYLPFNSATFAAIVTSPPYGSMYDYFDVQRLSYLAFDWTMHRSLQIGRTTGVERDGKDFTPPSSIRRWYQDLLGGENRSEGRAIRAYTSDMQTHLVEALRVLRPGGVALYAIANSIRRDGVLNLVGALRETMKAVGFEDVRSTRRRRNIKAILPLNRSLESGRFSTAGTEALRERVVIAKKPRA